MSVASATPSAVSSHPTNNSKSKQHYSFSKNSRFPPPPKILNQHIGYDIPPTTEKRACSFGYGRKYDFTSGRKASPPPNSYNMPSEFSSARAKNAPSFGASREKASKVFVKGHFTADPTVPGPGAYYNERSYTDVSKKYTISGKHQALTERQRSDSPGPGAYPINLTVAPGKSVLSTHKDYGVANFAKSGRSRLGLISKANLGVPGPGSYTPRTHALSKYSSTERNYLSTGARTSLASSNTRDVPGPGSYKLPSEFGEFPQVLKSTRSQPVFKRTVDTEQSK
jgi:hypothetical protein